MSCLHSRRKSGIVLFGRGMCGLFPNPSNIMWCSLSTWIVERVNDNRRRGRAIVPGYTGYTGWFFGFGETRQDKPNIQGDTFILMEWGAP